MRSFSALQLIYAKRKVCVLEGGICSVIYFLVRQIFLVISRDCPEKFQITLDKKVNQDNQDNGRFILEAISLVLKVSKGGLSFSKAV